VDLFTLDDHRRLVAGDFTVTFRLWTRARVTVGKTYPTPWGGGYRIDAVDVVRAGDVEDADAWAAGSPDRAALLKKVASFAKKEIGADAVLTRVRLAYVDEAPRKPALSVDEAIARLRRLDENAGRPWTQATLAAIEREPRVLARVLAEGLGRERLPFKVDVRKLKALGLTISHDVGYELAPLGQAVLDRLRASRRDLRRLLSTRFVQGLGASAAELRAYVGDDDDGAFRAELARAIRDSEISPAEYERLTACDLDAQADVDRFLVEEIWRPLYGDAPIDAVSPSAARGRSTPGRRPRRARDAGRRR
jgi:hypothetical protein